MTRFWRRWLLWPTCAIRGHRMAFYAGGKVSGHPERYCISLCGCRRRTKVEQEHAESPDD